MCGRLDAVAAYAAAVPSPGADVTGVSPVPEQMWQWRAQSQYRMQCALAVAVVPKGCFRFRFRAWSVLDHNRLSGTLPGWLSSLTQLRIVDLSQNQLVGLLSPLANAMHLMFLVVSLNRFTGSIPEALPRCRPQALSKSCRCS